LKGGVEMKEILKAFGKEVLEKAKKKFEDAKKNIKPKLQLPKNFVEMDLKLGEKIQFSFQVKRPEKSEGAKKDDRE